MDGGILFARKMGNKAGNGPRMDAAHALHIAGNLYRRMAGGRLAPGTFAGIGQLF